MSPRSTIPETMLAAVIHGPGEIRLEQVAVPQPGFGEVLVEVSMCGTCGSDLTFLDRPVPNTPPYGQFIPGHEWTGTVVSLGESVDEVQLGDRVAIAAHHGCGYCRNCRSGRFTVCENFGNREKGHRATGITAGGGFAEYVVHHVGSIVAIPDEVSDELAVMVTTAGTGIHGLSRVPGGIAGRDVGVVGPGSIGLMAAQAARALGARTVTVVGTRQERLDTARELGFNRTLLWSDLQAQLEADPTGAARFDVLVETSGAVVVAEHSIALTRSGGHVLLLAYYKGEAALDLSDAVRREVSLITSRGEGGLAVPIGVGLAADGRITGAELVTHRVELENVHQAFALMRDRSSDAVKIVVIPPKRKK